MIVSPKSRLVLWTRAAGRCQYTGCNKLLLGDLISGVEMLNSAFVAHIVAQTPDGPRGDPVRSPLLVDAVENLMLLCHPHHRLVDIEALEEHPEHRLLAMKAQHETRIAAVTDIREDRATHVLLYAARVGQHDCPVRYDLAKAALLPERYPAETRAIQLDLAGCSYQDHEPEFWAFQQGNLQRQFNQKVRERIAAGDVKHLSVFALAPQPLLIELGRLLSDIPATEVHQLHREPQDWQWRPDGSPLKLVIGEPSISTGIVALKIALSATVTDERIQAALDSSAAIWSITAEKPHNDLLQRQEDLSTFRCTIRTVFDLIKARHGEHAEIHIFPALPVSAAVEVGRVWMPKADLPLIIYDQNRAHGGFQPRLRVGAQPSELAA